MWTHYIKMAWRNLLHNKLFSIINVLGLSVGLACSMLIILYVKDENSFDRFHKNEDHIYRIVSQAKMQGNSKMSSTTGYFQGPKFAEHVPGIQSFTRYQQSSQLIKKGTDVRSDDQVFQVDANFFTVFTFPLLAGDPNSCLLDPHSIVLSKDEAMKQFGSIDVIGKIVQLKSDSGFIPYSVTAVAKNCPQNSSIRFDAIMPLIVPNDVAGNNENWFNSFLNTFIVLQDNANRATVEKQMEAFFIKDASATFKTLIKKYGIPADQISLPTYHLQTFARMHMDPHINSSNGLQQTSKPVYSYILAAIALFILLIACINFVNLTVARSVKRAKEIGIRKVIGGDRKQLIKQFLGESLLLCAIAFIFALAMTSLLLPLFNALSDKALALSYLFDLKLVLGYILLFLLTGFLAGLYPAIILSGFDPVKILYSRFHLSGKNYLQRSLVVVQFVLASFLIILTFVLYKQFNFLTHANLGYDDNNIVLVDQSATHSKAAVFKSLLLKNPNITTVAAKNRGTNSTIGRLSNDSVMKFRYETIDEAFLPELKIPMVQGRNFSVDIPSDSTNSILVNEAFVKEAGWANALGQTIQFPTSDNKSLQVVGVVKDYHYGSMNESIEPQVFTMNNANDYGNFYVKIKAGTASATLPFIQSTFNAVFPLTPYSYSFKNDDNKMQYRDIQKWQQMILFGAALTIFISFIGLFGLSILACEKRKKEVGIRKVYGASVSSIVRLLSSDFLMLVTLALIISAPLAWLAAYKFQEGILYRVPLNWTILVIPDILILGITFLIISTQTRSSARANPIKSLKME